MRSGVECLVNSPLAVFGLTKPPVFGLPLQQTNDKTPDGILVVYINDTSTQRVVQQVLRVEGLKDPLLKLNIFVFSEIGSFFFRNWILLAGF